MSVPSEGPERGISFAHESRSLLCLYLVTSLLLCFLFLPQSNRSGCSRVMRSHSGWNWNHPTMGMPTCECVSFAVS